MRASQRIRSASLVASLLLALAPGAVAPVSQAAPAGDRPAARATTDRATTDRPTARAAQSRYPINTAKKGEVARAWKDRMARQLTVQSGWTGSTKGCRAGKPSSNAQRATLSSINFARALAGLDAVRFADRLSAHAQKAALIMAANGALSHTPPKSWKCWTKEGSAAAGRSNLALSYPTMTAGGSVAQYLTDDGDGNTAAGHRRWVLNPEAAKFGNGLTSTTNALYVLGPSDAGNTNPSWVAWPTAGYFPTPLEPHGRWSLSSGADGADFSDATVTVQKGATTLRTTPYPVANGYGQPTLVFEVQGVSGPGTYQVTVSNIRGAAATSKSWKVKLFRP